MSKINGFEIKEKVLYAYHGNDKKIVIPDNVEIIADFSFSGNENVIEVYVPNSVKLISYGAFAECLNLKKIVLSEGLECINYEAFSMCKSLESIHIPASVSIICGQAFDGCINLKRIVVDKNNQVYDSREDCNAIIETKTNTLITGCSTSIITDTISKIGIGAFSGFTNITKIVIPNSVTEIKEEAFSYCENLKDIELPKNLKCRLESNIFNGCKSLERLEIPSGVLIIEGPMFGFSNNLKEIVVDKNNQVYDSREGCNAIIETSTNYLVLGCCTTVIPNTVKKISNRAFYGCNKLRKIDIPDSVVEIQDYAFSCCDSLKSFGISPNSKCLLSPNVFYASDIEEITISNLCKIDTIELEDIKYHLSSFFGKGFFLTGYSVFECLEDKGPLEQYFIPESLKKIRITNMDTIPSGSFYNCKGIEDITLAKSLTKIEKYAFAYCSSLINISFEGTKNEWNLVQKEDHWDDYTPNYIVHCVDGNINKA